MYVHSRWISYAGSLPRRYRVVTADRVQQPGLFQKGQRGTNRGDLIPVGFELHHAKIV